MKLKVDNEVASEDPSPEDIETALRSLDGYRRQRVSLIDSAGTSLTISRRRGPNFHVSIVSEQSDLIIEKSSKRSINLQQAIAAAQGWMRGESNWPPLMRWSESVNVSKEAHGQDLAEVRRYWRERPWKMTGWTVVLFLGVSVVQLLLYVPADYYADRGFASIFLRDPTLTQTILVNLGVTIVVNILIGLWLWEQHLTDENT